MVMKISCVCVLSHFSHVQLCVTPQTAAHQALPSLGFSRQEHWSGLPFPSTGDLPDPGIEPRSPALQADSCVYIEWTFHLTYTAIKRKSKNQLLIVSLNFFLCLITMAPHSSTLAWKIPWTEECSRLQSMGSQRVRHDWATSLHFTTVWKRKPKMTQPISHNYYQMSV